MGTAGAPSGAMVMASHVSAATSRAIVGTDCHWMKRSYQTNEESHKQKSKLSSWPQGMEAVQLQRQRLIGRHLVRQLFAYQPAVPVVSIRQGSWPHEKCLAFGVGDLF